MSTDKLLTQLGIPADARAAGAKVLLHNPGQLKDLLDIGLSPAGRAQQAAALLDGVKAPAGSQAVPLVHKLVGFAVGNEELSAEDHAQLATALPMTAHVLATPPRRCTSPAPRSPGPEARRRDTRVTSTSWAGRARRCPPRPPRAQSGRPSRARPARAPRWAWPATAAATERPGSRAPPASPATRGNDGIASKLAIIVIQNTLTLASGRQFLAVATQSGPGGQGGTGGPGRYQRKEQQRRRVRGLRWSWRPRRHRQRGHPHRRGGGSQGRATISCGYNPHQDHCRVRPGPGS